jgi:hypothetical protein
LQKEEDLCVQVVVEIICYKEDRAADLQFSPQRLDIPPTEKTAAPVAGLGPGIRKVQVEAVHRVIGQMPENRLGGSVDDAGVGEPAPLDFSLSF